MQVIAWCVYSYSAPFPSLPQLSPFHFPGRFPHPPTLVHYEANKHWATWHRVTPAIRGDGKTKRLHLFPLNSAPPPPHPPPQFHASSSFCVQSVFVARVKRPHSVSGFPQAPPCAPPPPTPTLSPSNLNPVHPRLKVYLRLWLSDNEGLNVNIQSTSSLNTSHAERLKKKKKKKKMSQAEKKRNTAQSRAEQRRTR